MLRRSLSILLTLACAVHGPSLAWAGPPEDVDARAEGLFNEGKYLEAAELQVAALNALPESLANRPQRNLWATGAVNAYLQVFTADPTQCTAATAGLAVADDYLKALLGEYGASVASADEYTGMQRLHGELDEARARNGCPAAEGAPATVATDAVAPEPPPRPGPSSARARAQAEMRRKLAHGPSARTLVIAVGRIAGQRRGGGRRRARRRRGLAPANRLLAGAATAAANASPHISSCRRRDQIPASNCLSAQPATDLVSMERP